MSGIEPDKVRAIVEAILLTAETPVTPGKLSALLNGLSGREIRVAIDELKTHYESAGHAFTVVELAGGYQLATRQEYGPWVRRFHDRSQVRLSPAALETLAIVAFKQPATRAQIENVRGVHCGPVLRTLLEYDLIRIAGRSEGIGRPILFGTTKEFLIYFGLKTLADLPRPRDLEDLLEEGARKAVPVAPAAANPAAEVEAGLPEGVPVPAEEEEKEPPWLGKG